MRVGDIPLLLFTGMAADERLFEGQIEAFDNVIAPRWIDAEPNESIRNYARRMVDRVAIEGPCFVGGASFGGVVAQEAAQFLDTRGVFLIGSIRHPRELPTLMRIWKFMGHFPDASRRRLMAAAAILAGPFVPRPTARRMRMIAQPEQRFCRWASMALLRWQPTPIDPRIRVFHIHGDADKTLPVKYTRPDVIVPGGDHILSYRRAATVNAFLRAKMESCLARAQQRAPV